MWSCTDREHNSNSAHGSNSKRAGIDHRVAPSQADNSFDMEAFEAACADAGERLKMVAMSHVGNLDGVEIPIPRSPKSPMTTVRLSLSMEPKQHHT